MADNTIATYYVQLEPTTKGITSGIEKEFSGLGKTGGNALSAALGTALSGAAGGIAGVAMNAVSGGISAITDGISVITDFGKASVESGAQFDSSMSQVAATMGTTVDEIENLRNFAQEMGASTTFSATQAADALNYMALAGYDANTSMQMLPNVLNLAAAGNFDLARASDMVTDTQTAFGISLERTSQMVDEMAKAASTGNTSVEQLGDAFLVVGGLTQELNGGFIQMGPGVSRTVDGVQELEIALTAMANAGIKGSEAGTHMRNMLLKLSDPTKDGAVALEEMGVSVFNTEGQMRSLADIFGDLSNKMDDMTQQEKISVISDLFNTRDIASAEALLNAVDQDWTEIGKSILQADGAAQQMADTQLDNLAGDITLFKSALEGVQIIISDQLTPTIREVVELGTGALQAFTDGFQEGGIEGAISGVIDFVADNLESVATKIIEIIPEIIKKGIELTQKIAPEIINLLVNEVFPMLMDTLTELMASYLETMPEMLTQSFDIMSTLIPMVIDLATQLLVAFAQTFSEMAPVIYPAVIDLMTIIVNTLLDNLPLIFDAAVLLIIGMADGLLSSLPSVVSAIMQIIAQLIATVIELIPHIAAAAIQLITEFLTTIVTTALAFYSGDFWKKMLDGIISSFTDIDWAGIGKMLTEGITDGIKAGWNKIKEAATDVADGIKGIFTNIFDIHSPSKLFEYYGEMIDEGLALGIERKDGVPVSAVEDLSDNITGSFKAKPSANESEEKIINIFFGNELFRSVVVDALATEVYISGGR